MHFLTKLALLLLSLGQLGCGEDPAQTNLQAQARTKAWQAKIDQAEFVFSEAAASMQYSLGRVPGPYFVNVERRVSQWQEDLVFKIFQETKEVLLFEGHRGSVFLAEHGYLYLANYDTSCTGCKIHCYDLTSGKEVWKTELVGLGLVKHSNYQNLINMQFAGQNSIDAPHQGAIVIYGNEAFGCYIEVLDRATGKQLANRQFSRIYPEIDWPKKTVDGADQVDGTNAGDAAVGAVKNTTF
jgi:outer membrane protein assembly factor BamB